MSIYALLNSTKTSVVEYPLTIFQIRGKYENISWPETPTVSQLEDYDIVIVNQELTTIPELTSNNTVIIENDPVYDTEHLVWKQSFSEVLNEGNLDVLKETQLELLSETRYNNEINGIAWSGNIINTDRDSQMKLLSLYNMCLDGYITEINWKCKNNVFIVLSAQDAIALALTVANYVKLCFDRESVLMTQIKSATTVQELQWSWVSTP